MPRCEGTTILTVNSPVNQYETKVIHWMNKTDTRTVHFRGDIVVYLLNCGAFQLLICWIPVQKTYRYNICLVHPMDVFRHKLVYRKNMASTLSTCTCITWDNRMKTQNSHCRICERIPSVGPDRKMQANLRQKSFASSFQCSFRPWTEWSRPFYPQYKNCFKYTYLVHWSWIANFWVNLKMKN